MPPKEETKKQEKEVKKPLSIVIINTGKRPVPIKKTAREFIVLHPNKEMRLETIIAERIMMKFRDVKKK